MVSPLRTLQSSNSLRNSIASLAWFKASCMDVPRARSTGPRRLGGDGMVSRPKERGQWRDRLVARMKRSGMRGKRVSGLRRNDLGLARDQQNQCAGRVDPTCVRLHPGYKAINSEKTA